MKKFSDFADEQGLVGEKMPVAEVFNKTIVVTGYRIIDSTAVKGKRCLQLQFELNGEKHVLFSTSEVLLRQTEKYAEHIPFETVIKKVGSYHTFT